jgi:diaminopimelate decarboxylase
MALQVSSRLLPLTWTANEEGRLIVGGCDVIDLAEQYGTPLYVYDEWTLRQRCQQAVFAFGEGVSYASKAFLCGAMARLVTEEGLSIDVASAGEMFVALRAGVSPAKIVFHGNNKSTQELTYALQQKIGRIVVDSLQELERLKRLAGFGYGKPKVLIRVTPGVDAQTHESIATGHEDVKFGLSISSGAATEAVIKARREDSGVELVGIHAHVGSQITNVEDFEAVVDKMATFFLPLGLPELVIGGGLGVPYVSGESAPTMGEWGDAVRRAKERAGISSSVHLGVEPGRAIAATAGMTLYRVGTIKDLPEIRTYVAVDGGMSDNLRPMLYDAKYEAFLPREVGAERTKPIRLVGKHCESGDVIIDEAWVPDDLKVGDVLAVPVTGAYGHSMANNYNRIPRPAVVFVCDGKSRVVVRRETYEDLVNLDVF